MSGLIHDGLQFIIVFAMTVVGLELTPADIRRVLHYPAHVGIALAAQVLMLPLVGAAVIAVFRPDPVIAGGLVLVAAAPQATVSNFYCLLARADVALSVTLTAVTSVVALLTTPWVAALGFEWLHAERSGGVVLPVLPVVRQVFTGIVLPIAAGMALRHLAPAFVLRQKRRLQMASLALLAVLLVAVFVTDAARIAAQFAIIVATAATFTIAALAGGVLLARAFRWPAAEAVTMAAAFPSRSLSIATLVAINVLGSVEFVTFAVVFFVVQAALMLPLMTYARRRTGP